MFQPTVREILSSFFLLSAPSFDLLAFFDFLAHFSGTVVPRLLSRKISFKGCS